MKILVVNCGSSSLKYQLIDMDTESVLAKGNYEKIGIPGSFLTHKVNGEKIKIENDVKNHEEAIAIVLLEHMLLVPPTEIKSKFINMFLLKVIL